MKKLTQKQSIFYQLIKEKKRNSADYIPLWKLMGEVYCVELDLWGFVSYEIPARMSEMYQDNEGMLERVIVTGKSGARYYAYRLADDYHSHIRDDKLRMIYDVVCGEIDRV